MYLLERVCLMEWRKLSQTRTASRTKADSQLMAVISPDSQACMIRELGKGKQLTSLHRKRNQLIER